MALLRKALDDEIVQMGLMVSVISGVFLVRLLVTGGAPPTPPPAAAPPPGVAQPAAQAPAPATQPGAGPAPRAYAGGAGITGVRSRIKGKWLVDAAGGPEADLPSIAQAILNAEPGDRIEVKPGRYKENLVFNGKDLNVVGLPTADGKIGVVLEGAEADHAVTVANGKVSIESLDVEQPQEGVAGIYAQGGALKVANVALRAPRGTALFVADSDVTAEHSSFTGSSGIQQWSGALLCDDCVVANSGQAGVTVGVKMKGTAGKPRATFRNLSLKNSAKDGLLVQNAADVKLDASEISGNLNDGVAVFDKAILQLKSCRIQQNVHNGVWAEGESFVEVVDGRIARNENGIASAAASSVSVRGTEIAENLMGYLYQDETRITLLSPSIHDNRGGEKGRITIGPKPASVDSK